MNLRNLHLTTSLTGVNVKAGDVIEVASPQPGKPYIATVQEIAKKEERTPGAEILVQWWYRPEDCRGGRKCYHGKKELFMTHLTDWIDERSVLTKVTVQDGAPPLEERQGRRSSAVRPASRDAYFTRQSYDPDTEKFTPSQYDVYCLCEMPYNPDEEMIVCNECYERYHPACLNLKGASLSRAHADANWVCPGCDFALKVEAGKLTSERAGDANGSRPGPHKRPRRGR